MDNIYNSTETTGFRDDAKIVHYIRERKGWIKSSPRSEIWFNYHNEMIGGNKMDNYYVKALINFNDYEGRDINGGGSFIERVAGQSEWWCSAERYQYLKDHNAVELIEIKEIKLPKEEPKEPEIKIGPQSIEINAEDLTITTPKDEEKTKLSAKKKKTRKSKFDY